MLRSGASRITCLDPLLTLSVICVSIRSQIARIKTNTKNLSVSMIHRIGFLSPSITPLGIGRLVLRILFIGHLPASISLEIII